MRRNILNMIKENNEAGLQANISQQSDEKFIIEAAGIISELRKVFEENKTIRDSEQLMVDSLVGSTAVKKLEELFNRRFISNSKASFRILAGVDENSFAHVITPNTAKSILTNKASYVEEELNNVISFLEKDYGATKHQFINEELNYNSIDGYKKILERNIRSAKELEKKLKVSAVEFDLKNAKINGLPDDMYFMICFDFVYFIKNFTDREILSVLLHEIGHIYTVLTDLFRTANTNVIMYDIMSTLNFDNPDKIAITMAKEFGVEAPNLKGKNREKEFLLFVSNVMDSLAKPKIESTKSSATVERLADMFPVRMGLGVEYFNINKKINLSTSGYSEMDYRLDIPSNSYISNGLLLIGVAMFIVGMAISLGLIILGAYLSFIGVLLRAMIVLQRFFIGTDDANSTIYDDSKRRLESIRNDFVRRINSAIPKDSLDRTLIKERILELEVMDNEISKFRKGRSLIGMVGEFIIPSLRTKSRETLINEMLENMEANKLQVLSEKIKLSGGL